jgi:alkaline phosphatase D
MSVRIRLGVLAVALAAAAHTAGAELPATLPHGVSAGDVTASTAVLWARSTVLGDVTFELGTTPAVVDPLLVGAATVVDPAVPVKFLATGLQSDTVYHYRVTDAGGASLTGRFRTVPEPGDNTRVLSFGVTGDWRGELSPYPAIANADRRLLDFFIKLGDTYYADFPSRLVDTPQARTLEEYRAKNMEVYSTQFGINTWADLQASTSIVATIDDHEVTNDFAGGALASSDGRFDVPPGNPDALINETELYQNGLQAFQEYNAIEERLYVSVPGLPDQLTDGRPDLYRVWAWGDTAAFFLLDARSFRDEELAPVLNPFSAEEVTEFFFLSFDLDPVTGEALPERTMLSRRQLQRLQEDLLAAEAAGITWKFVFVPEPIQNLSPALASDRFEGYARERTELLRFIDEQAIPNVVFVSADIHGTVVNNLTYQLGPGLPQIPITTFEITTGSVAFDPPFGPTALGVLDAIEILPGLSVLDLLLRAIGIPDSEAFDALPANQKNLVFEVLINLQLRLFDYDPIGLQGSPVDARLLRGRYTAVFSYGWSEFLIVPGSRALRVTTYGIDPYTREEIETDPAVSERRPQIVSRFWVRPTP